MNAATDEQGNINNVILVQEKQPISASPTMAPARGEKSLGNDSADTDAPDNFSQAGKPEVAPAVPAAEISVQAEDEPPTSLSSTTSAAAPQASPLMRGVSHDLPTPPISERGDDVQSKDALLDDPPDYSRESKESAQKLEQSGEEKPSTGSPSGWSRTG